MNLQKWLSHPKLRDVSIDDPRTTTIRRVVINENPFLRRIYQEWYERLTTTLPEQPGRVLELGSGAGFLADHVPGLITSEIFYLPFVNIILEGQQLPFVSASLRGILMSNVLHHIPCPRDFFHEASRCIRPGGVISMIEPWVSRWSRNIYSRLHHEPFHPDAVEWEFPTSGPLSGANGALPWILFKRDLALFNQEFPEWEVASITPFMPFRYLISGGVSMRPIIPGWSHNFWALLESCFSPWINYWAMFAHITLAKRKLEKNFNKPIKAITYRRKQ
jgi:SAM-dependent methyltransferase